MNRTREIRNTFNKYALQYEKAAIVQQEIGQRLFERLHYLKINPRYILDLGCGTGSFMPQLAQLYPNAKIIGLDLALVMLLAAQQNTGQKLLVNGDMLALPFATGVFDLIFANQAIHWAYPMHLVMRELNRVMHTNACLMFATLGPDTLKELKLAWQKIDAYAHVNEFIDMHDLGDCVLNEHFLDPVIDMEVLTIHYDHLKQLLSSLKAQGVRNINPKRNNGLTGKKCWLNFEKAYEVFRTVQGKYPLTYEVIYGHAWKGTQTKVDDTIETFIPIDQIFTS